MCNINVVVKKDKRRSQQVTECLNTVTHLSYQSNKDGDGYFTENFKVKKALEKQIIRGSHWLGVTHQRLSTSGKHVEMTQPLESDNFIFVHNGIFRGKNTGDDTHSDTHKVLDAIEESYAETEDIVTTLRLLLKEQPGYWSCILYDKNTKQLLYFKDKTSSMYMINNDKHVLMSTKQVNVEYMRKYFECTDDIIEPEPFVIYDMNDNFNPICTWKEYKEPPTLTPTWSHYGGLTSLEDSVTSDDYPRSGVTKMFNLLAYYYIYPKTVARHKDKQGHFYYLIVIDNNSDAMGLQDAFSRTCFLSKKKNNSFYFCMYEEDFIEEYESYEEGVKAEEVGFKEYVM